MTYLHLLSPQGEPFEVIESRAGKLLTEGWTFNSAPLDREIQRIDEVADTVSAFEEPVESSGAIADAQNFAVDAPVTEEAAPAVEAGPDEDVTDVPNVTQGDDNAPVEASRNEKRRRPFTSDV